MKKRFIILSIFLSLILVGCKNKDEKILISSTYEADSAILISKTELTDKIDCQDDFVLYVYTEGCTSCLSFERTVLNEYIKEYDADVFKVSSGNIDGVIRTTSKYRTNPRIIVFKDGEIYKQTAYTVNEKVFTGLDSFKNYLNEYVKVSSLKEISYSQLTSLLNDGEDKIIYYHWNECGDCSYLENHHLKEYLFNHNVDNFYSFEVSDYRKYKNSANSEEKEIYDNFLELAKYNIEGNNGVVPTAIYLKNNEVEKYMIYFNDIFAENSLTVIKTSYGETDASICKTYSSYAEYQDQTSSYHNQKFEQFMNSTNLLK